MTCNSHEKTTGQGYSPGYVISGGRCLVLLLAASVGLLGCTAARQKEPIAPGGYFWPVAGIGGFCTGEEQLSTALEASRRAAQLGNEARRLRKAEAEETQPLRDKTQCIFAAHAKRGDPEGMYLLAQTLMGIRSYGGQASDYRRPSNAQEQTVRLLQEAGRRGHGPALILSMTVVPAQQRGDWIREAAEVGNIEAQYELGEAHLEGGPFKHGIPRDSQAAEKWLQLAAQRGHVFAAMELGGLYERGETGVEMDKRKALTWLEPLLDKPPVSRGGRGFDPQGPGLTLQLAGLYCALGEREKALPMYQRAYNVGEAEAREYLGRECR